MRYSIFIIIVFLLTGVSQAIGQSTTKSDEKEKKQALDTLAISGLKWRSVGPALTSGRISDIAVNPDNPFEYYAAVSSGGVWKTSNAGTTYQSIFDGQTSYSIGCVTIDPNNHQVVWVGTGENNNQRSVAYGDGVYRSDDGGQSWQHKGLKESEHIGKIIVHPKNSNVVYVAAIGPLWSKGGDRGLFKTTNGGETWENVLSIDEHTGVNDVVMDPRNPEVLYASTFQRRRHVYTYVGGGPGSGLHKSTDGGATWQKIQKGLPDVELGRIGLAISPADPEIIYAIVEAAQGKGGFFRSTNRGANWEKRSGHSTSGNYYQEIIADPVDPNTIYSMDTWMQISRDGGKTFQNAGEDFKHVDNHSIWINPANNKHWLVGCDGGIYETFDAAATWDFKENLPVTQFYKVAVDNDEPFYNIYGGTQDNFSIGGPSRVITAHGITNQDWYITHGGDGFESQVDPENPDIVYSQSQYGVLVRYDRKSGEELGIQPKERKGEDSYRWNWDAPLAVSHHVPGRLYFAANKLFRTDDRGQSWDVISGDLTRQLDRNQLKVYDRIVSIDAVSKNGSTSPYGTIVAFSESPLDNDLLVVGTDDGLIQITEDGGATWRKIDNIAGAPAQSYVNAVVLSRHDANTVYAAFNHHKYGDFKPYIFRSKNRGETWTSISSNLPERGSVYAIEEDHEDPGLLFCGTEFSFYFSPNGGERWKKLANGLPPIAVRDIAVQRRENDLVLGTFGRGFYVLDDYSVLRQVENSPPTDVAKIFPVRPALHWEKSLPLGLPGKAFQGDNFYSANNLGPEAMITYYYGDKHKTLEETRQSKEKKLIEKNEDTPYPTYEQLKAERDEAEKELMLTIRNSAGEVIKKIIQKPSVGIHRVHWDLRYNTKDPIDLSRPSFYNPFAGSDEGTLVAPGTYNVTMSLIHQGAETMLTGPVSFEVKALNNTVLPAADRQEKVDFQREVTALAAEMSQYQAMMSEIDEKLRYIAESIKMAEDEYSDLAKALFDIQEKARETKVLMYGDPVKNRLDIDQPPSPYNRIGWITYEQKYSTATPTETHRMSLAITKEEFGPIKEAIKDLYTVDLKNLEKALESSGAPYTPGRVIKQKN